MFICLYLNKFIKIFQKKVYYYILDIYKKTKIFLREIEEDNLYTNENREN